MHRPNPQEHVNMIVRPVDDQSRSLHLANNPSEIGKQITPKLRFDQCASPESGEDEMQQDVSRCVGQASFAPSGATLVFNAPTHSLRRGLHSFDASRLLTPLASLLRPQWGVPDILSQKPSPSVIFVA
jgi:hypothetical protein